MYRALQNSRNSEPFNAWVEVGFEPPENAPDADLKPTLSLKKLSVIKMPAMKRIILNVQKRKKREKYLKKYKEILKVFCSKTTVNGLRFIERSRIHRIAWIVLVITMIVVCLYQCGRNLETYLAFNIRTKLSTDLQSTIEFPAVTFCPRYNFKRSGYSKFPAIFKGVASLVALNETNIPMVTRQIEKTCKRTVKGDISDNGTINLENLKSSISDIKRALVEIRDYSDALKNSSVFFDPLYVHQFEDVLQKCMWNKRSFPCNEAFVNRMTSISACFTFNPGDTFARRLLQDSRGKGINMSKYSKSVFNVTSAKHGLRLVLKLDQKENCDSDELKGGTGLMFNVHGKNRMPCPLRDAFHFLSPGFDYRIEIQLVKTVRKTEKLGLCTNRHKLIIAPETEIYSSDLCYIQCMFELMLLKCKCLPPAGKGFDEAFRKHAKRYKIDENKFRICLLDIDMGCINSVLLMFVNDAFAYTLNLCNCPKPCLEHGYEIQMTSLILSNKIFNKSQEELRKNFLAISFNFATMVVETIEETQAFTIKDLFIYFGNNIFLYLGMSLMSPFEIGMLIVELSVASVTLTWTDIRQPGFQNIGSKFRTHISSGWKKLKSWRNSSTKSKVHKISIPAPETEESQEEQFQTGT